MPPSEEDAFDRTSDRIEQLVQHATRQGESISSITNAQLALEVRVRALEASAQSRAIMEAREDERDKALYRRLDAIELDIKSIKGVGSKALWVVISAVILAAVAFVLKGGLA